MPPRRDTGLSEEVERMIAERVAARVAEAVAAERIARRQNEMPPQRECTFSSFMKCGPTQFHGKEGVVELCRWMEKIESTFSISECAERNKVKFAAATLHGRALTWWNNQVATLGLTVANGKPWIEFKKMMLEEFCPEEEIARLEDELRNLKLRDKNIAAYTQRFNELVLLCPDAVPNEKKKLKLYIKGLPEIIKGETTSSKPTTLSEAVRMAHTLMEQKIQAEAERFAKGNKRRWENDQDRDDNNNNHHDDYNNRRRDGARAMVAAQDDDDQEEPAPRCDRCGWCHFGNCPMKCSKCGRIGHKARDCTRRGVATGENTRRIRACYECGERDHNRSQCPKRNNHGGGNATGRVHAIRDVEQGQGPNFVTGNQG